MAKNIFIGQDVEVPVYTTYDIDITEENIEEYFDILKSQFSWTTTNEGVKGLRPNNIGKHSSLAELQLTFTKDCTFTFFYTLNTEQNQDLFELWENKEGEANTWTYVSLGAGLTSGVVTAEQKSFTYSAGRSIRFSYTKNASNHASPEECIIYNMKINFTDQSGIENKTLAHKVNKLYLGIDNIARRIKKVYIGDENSKAQLCYQWDCKLTLQVMVTAGMHFDYKIIYPSGNIETGYYNSFGTPPDGFNDSGQRVYEIIVPYGSTLTLTKSSWDSRYTWDTTGIHAWPESPQIITKDTNIQFNPRYVGSTTPSYYILTLSLGTGVKSVDYAAQGYTSGTFTRSASTSSKTFKMLNGETYSFTNPIAESGYTMNATPNNASGTMPASNRTVSFTATANSGGGGTNTYTVRFYNEDGDLIKEYLNVSYGSSVTPPTLIVNKVPGGFAGEWKNTGYTYVTQNLDIYPKLYKKYYAGSKTLTISSADLISDNQIQVTINPSEIFKNETAYIYEITSASTFTEGASNGFNEATKVALGYDQGVRSNTGYLKETLSLYFQTKTYDWPITPARLYIEYNKLYAI